MIFIYIHVYNGRLGLDTRILQGDSVNLLLERQELADVLCDEDEQNWGMVIASLGDGKNDQCWII